MNFWFGQQLNKAEKQIKNLSRSLETFANICFEDQPLAFSRCVFRFEMQFMTTIRTTAGSFKEKQSLRVCLTSLCMKSPNMTVRQTGMCCFWRAAQWMSLVSIHMYIRRRRLCEPSCLCCHCICVCTQSLASNINQPKDIVPYLRVDSSPTRLFQYRFFQVIGSYLNREPRFTPSTGLNDVVPLTDNSACTCVSIPTLIRRLWFLFTATAPIWWTTNASQHSIWPCTRKKKRTRDRFSDHMEKVRRWRFTPDWVFESKTTEVRKLVKGALVLLLEWNNRSIQRSESGVMTKLMVCDVGQDHDYLAESEPVWVDIARQENCVLKEETRETQELGKYSDLCPTQLAYLKTT